MKELTIDDILGCDDIEIEPVEVPSWGGTVYVRTITGDKRDAFDSLFARDDDGKVNMIGVRAKLVAMCLCDSKGTFVSPSDAQVITLGKKSAAMLERCFEACQRINGMLTKDIEKLEKNLEAVGANDSG